MKMTIDEAIKHCLEVAEKNDSEAEVYDLLAKNHNSTYEKLTALRFCTDCVECAADHRQLAEWLTELKDLREKHWNECRQIAHYDDELKQLMEYAKFTALDNLDLQDEIRELKQIGGENI